MFDFEGSIQENGLFLLLALTVLSVLRHSEPYHGSKETPQGSAVMTTNVRSLGANWRRALLVLVGLSLICAPISWIDDGVTPSWIVYPLVLLIGLWLMWRGRGTLYIGIAATIFLLIHVPFSWAALAGDRSPQGPDHPFNPVQWLITLFVLPLLTAIVGFLAWREARRRPAVAPQRAAT